MEEKDCQRVDARVKIPGSETKAEVMKAWKRYLVVETQQQPMIVFLVFQ
jgi:hypothetical protein